MDAGAGEVLVDVQGNAFELRHVSCPTCGPGQPFANVGLRGGEHHRYRLGVVTLIVRCRGCGLLYANPFPHPRAPQVLYGDPEKYFVRHDLEDKIEVNRHVAREMKRLTGVDRPSVIDVGSGRGDFVEAARREGVECVGLEFSEAMIDFARQRFGITLVNQSIESHAATGARYDGAVLNAVLEHVRDPDSMVASAARLVRPGGLLYVDCPNEPNLVSRVGNAVNRLRGRRGVYNLSPSFPPYHVFGFNPRSIDVLLRKHGFEIIDLRLWASPNIPSQGHPGDRLAALAAGLVARLGNRTGTASNMYLWARRSPSGTEDGA